MESTQGTEYLTGWLRKSRYLLMLLTYPISAKINLDLHQKHTHSDLEAKDSKHDSTLYPQRAFFLQGHEATVTGKPLCGTAHENLRPN